jgi:hypothetical protein
MFPPGWHGTVRRYHTRTTGWVLAQSNECTATRDLEVSDEYVMGRRFEPLEPRDLQDLQLPASWFMGVLVCPEDDLTAIAEWAALLPTADLHRVRFYLHDAADPVAVFKPWYAAGLPSPDTEQLLVGKRFHQKFGRDHGNQVVRDAAKFGR